MKLLFVISFVAALISCIDANALLLTVYYESKCSDSLNFIVDQLAPTVHQLHDYLQLKLVPFGKANSVRDTIGPDAFECQHGPSECLGNMVQDCTIRHMVGRFDVSIVDYVKCEMQTQAGANMHFQCVQNAHVPVKGIKQCLNSEEGLQLQLQSEKLTKLVNPSFVPTITVNGVFNVRTQSQALHDLMGALCKYIPNVPQCVSRNSSVLYY